MVNRSKRTRSITIQDNNHLYSAKIIKSNREGDTIISARDLDTDRGYLFTLPRETELEKRNGHYIIRGSFWVQTLPEKGR